MNLRGRILQFACPLLLVAGLSSNAQALTCAEIGGLTDGSGNCSLTGAFDCTADTTIDVARNLTVNGALNCDGGGASPCNNLTLNVGGDLTVAGAITANGANGAAGTTPPVGDGVNATPGKPGCNIDINVTGNMTLSGAVNAAGGAGGPGGNASIKGHGGDGAPGANGGNVDINVKGTFEQTGGIGVTGGVGGAGGGGAGTADRRGSTAKSGGAGTPTANAANAGGGASTPAANAANAGGASTVGRGGNAGEAGDGGSVTIFACAVNDNGIINAAGGTVGGAGGGASTGNAGKNAGGGDGGTISESSGSDLILGNNALRIVAGGSEGSPAQGGSSSGPAGSKDAEPGKGGTITLNHCAGFALSGDAAAKLITAGGTGVPTGTGAGGTVTKLTNGPCCPCSIAVDKTVAPDDNCDGVANGGNDDANAAFVDSVVTDSRQCVVYKICVTNTSATGAGANDAPQTITNVQIDDAPRDANDQAFGNIPPAAPHNKVCKFIPGTLTSGDCAGANPNDPKDDTCVCENVKGVNTSKIDAATGKAGKSICSVSAGDPCLDPVNPKEPNAKSDCDDTASVGCTTPTPTRTPTRTFTSTPTHTRTHTRTKPPATTPTKKPAKGAAVHSPARRSAPAPG